MEKLQKMLPGLRVSVEDYDLIAELAEKDRRPLSNYIRINILEPAIAALRKQGGPDGD